MPPPDKLIEKMAAGLREHDLHNGWSVDYLGDKDFEAIALAAARVLLREMRDWEKVELQKPETCSRAVAFARAHGISLEESKEG